MRSGCEVAAETCAAVERCRARGGRVVAVGTTSVRALETAARGGKLAPFAGDSRLFIYPGFEFRVVDAMVTNFHLPESSLLMLVAAFAGRDATLAAYRHAVAQRYRFFSYGDAMLVTPQPRAASRMKFELVKQDGGARRGRITFRRGVIDTPAFMPVGTYGTVKAMTPEELEGFGAQIILGNTFHLLLRPGIDVIRAHGGLHAFTHWQRPILTDSGGFQVWSLQRPAQDHARRVSSSARPSTATSFDLTPERSIEMQDALGTDIVMVFDECTAYPAEHATARESMQLSLRWAKRSRAAFDELKRGRDSDAALFGIVQGGVHHDLRRESLAGLAGDRFPGLRRRRPRRRRARRGAARRARRFGARAAGGAAALPDGRRHAGGSREGRRARHGHVRLRDPDAARAQRPAVHERRAAEHPQ